MIEALRSELEADAQVDLLCFHAFPPAPEDALRTQPALKEEIRDFYRTANGWQVRWVYKDNDRLSSDDRDKLRPVQADWLWPMDQYYQLDGVINILPAELAFGGNWEDIMWYPTDKDFEVSFQKNQWNLLRFKQSLYPFDLFSKEGTVALLGGERKMPALLGADHNVDFTSYKPLPFRKYLEQLIATKGAVARYQTIFKAN